MGNFRASTRAACIVCIDEIGQIFEGRDCANSATRGAQIARLRENLENILFTIAEARLKRAWEIPPRAFPKDENIFERARIGNNFAIDPFYAC